MHFGKAFLWTLLWSYCLYGHVSTVHAQGGAGRSPHQVDPGLAAEYSKVHLLNGRSVTPYPAAIIGSANHRELGMTADCSLVFDGIPYQHIPLMYDLVTDELITRHPQRHEDLILESHLISQFTILGETFVRVREEQTGLSTGFYQEIYAGDTYASYAKHSKLIGVYNSGSLIERRYIPSITYYLLDFRHPAGTRIIRKQSDLLALDKTRRREVRKMLRENSLTFRSKPEQTLAAVLAYLDRQTATN